ncbi:hypothetical protein, partial [Ruegeria atlantica]|uniref:hypothetical protein n=1 Tax=Ruegeria atlantica TaxID=81569 RepID=UPI001C2C6C76
RAMGTGTPETAVMAAATTMAQDRAPAMAAAITAKVAAAAATVMAAAQAAHLVETLAAPAVVERFNRTAASDLRPKMLN